MLQGKVIKTLKNTAVIEVDMKECAGCKACIASSTKKFKIRAQNFIFAKVGDFVEVETSCELEIAAPLLTYLMPVVFSGLGLLIGKLIGGEKLMIALFLTMLLLSFFVTITVDKALQKKQKGAKIIKVLKSFENKE